MRQKLIRNIFDQYQQPENRLTNALIQVLTRNPHLTRKFIRRFAKRTLLPNRVSLSFACQRRPGDEIRGVDEEDYAEEYGIPDAWIYDEHTRWALIFECKIKAELDVKQLRRHVVTARKQGFNAVDVLIITADESRPSVLARVHNNVNVSWINWSQVYEFFASEVDGYFVSDFVSYMRIVEARMIADGHDDLQLTNFAGIPFGPNHPYNEAEAKAILRVLMRELRPRLAKSRILPKVDEKIQKGAMVGAWDIIGFGFASGEHFTRHPHLAVVLTTSLSDWRNFDAVWIQIVLPRNAKSEYWSRIRGAGRDRLLKVFTEVTSGIRPLRRRVEYGMWEPKLTLNITQRHFFARREWTRDGLIHFDLDTMLHKRRKIAGDVKSLPAWLDAAHIIGTQSRRANFELALQVRFPLSDRSVCRSPKFVDTLVLSANALQPFLKLLRG